MPTFHSNRLLLVSLSSQTRFGTFGARRPPLVESSRRVLFAATSFRGSTKPCGPRSMLGSPSTNLVHSRHNSSVNESTRRIKHCPCRVSKSSVPFNYSHYYTNIILNNQLPNFQGTTQFAALRIYHSSPNQKPTPRNRFTAGLAGLATGSVILVSKGKYLFSALKLTKFASLSSMILTVGAYTAFYGFPYAVGMTSLLLIHESGHALVMKRLGIPFSPMVFVPFMGAAVAMKKQTRDAYHEALVAFGGPVLGSLGALGFAGAGQAMGSDLLIALADFGFMINLFNMIPLGMMGGGRICGAVSPYAGLVGLGLGGTMAYQGMIHNPIIYLILMAGGYETFMRLYDPVGHAPTANYYRIASGKRALITGGYFGLVGALFAAMAWNRQYMVPPERLKKRQVLLERLE